MEGEEVMGSVVEDGVSGVELRVDGVGSDGEAAEVEKVEKDAQRGDLGCGVRDAKEAEREGLAEEKS